MSSDEQNLEHSLRVQRETFASVLDALDDGVIFLNEAFEVTFINQRAREMFSYEGEIVRRLVFDLLSIFDSSGGEVLMDALVKVRDGREERGFVDCLIQSALASMWANVTIRPIEIDGALSSIVLRLSDVTERMEAQERETVARYEAQTAERARQAQAAFLASMSHELRTPLNAIIGYTELILEETESLDDVGIWREDLNRINSAGRHLLSLINDVLDFSKIQSGRLELSVETVDLKPMLDDILSVVGPTISANGNTLSLAIEDDLPAIETDQVRLKQVMINLLGNAGKFTENGEIKLRVFADTNAVSIGIDDTGIGIPQSQLGTIFEPFEQLDRSPTRKFGGSGLGLAISKNICDALKADLTVSSKEGVGTSFLVSHPVIQERTGDSQSGIRIRWSPSRAPILLVDSNQETHDSVRRWLSNEKFVLWSERTIDQARDTLLQAKPAVILLDLFPNEEGWQLLKELKSDPAKRKIPVIICSTEDHRIKAARLGADGCLLKPLTPKELTTTVRTFSTVSQ